MAAGASNISALRNAFVMRVAWYLTHEAFTCNNTVAFINPGVKMWKLARFFVTCICKRNGFFYVLHFIPVYSRFQYIKRTGDMGLGGLPQSTAAEVM